MNRIASRKLIIGALLIVVLAASGGWRYLNYREWSAAYAVAHDSFSRAWEYKDAGTLVFEPRWKDFEVAIDKLHRVGHVGEEQEIKTASMVNCGDELHLYREVGAHADEAIRAGRSPDTYLNIQVKIRSSVVACFAEE